MSISLNNSNQNFTNKLCLGIIRQRTNKFLEIRKKIQEENHFSKSETGSSLNDNGKTSLLGNKNEKNSKITELTNLKNHNNKYIDIFNSTNVIYEELRQNFAILQSEQQKRIIPKFDDDENKIIDKRIKELIIEMTRKVRQADDNINQLSKIKMNTQSEQEMKENIKLNLATKIKEFSRDFQMNEEKYMRNYQELVGDTTNYDFEDLDGSSNQNTKNSKNDFLQLKSDNSSIILRKRDEEISTLLTSITELASVFKDLQTLVHHQGTILDRIDFNIESAGQNVKDAHKSLVATEKMMKSSCYRNSMMCMMITIFIMSILIIFKFTS